MTGTPLGLVYPVLSEGGIDSIHNGLPFYDKHYLSTNAYKLFIFVILNDVEDFVKQEASMLLRKGH